MCICAVNGVLNNHDLVNVSTEDVAMANVGQFDTSTDSNVINNICAGDKVMKVCYYGHVTPRHPWVTWPTSA